MVAKVGFAIRLLIAEKAPIEPICMHKKRLLWQEPFQAIAIIFWLTTRGHVSR